MSSSNTVDSLTPADRQHGDEPRLFAPRNAPNTSILIFRRAAGELAWVRPVSLGAIPLPTDGEQLLMALPPPGSSRVYVAMLTADADGRLREVEVLPDPNVQGDQVLVWDDSTKTVSWMTPEQLGFTGQPLVRDVPVTEGPGRFVVTGDGARILCNVPAGS